jgi:hypothetical protein
MSLEDDVTKIMNDALHSNPVAQRAATGDGPIISDTGSEDMIGIMESMIVGSRNAIIHLARYVDTT